MFIPLKSPHGGRIWVDPTHVVAIQERSGEQPACGLFLSDDVFFEVRGDAEEIAGQLNAAMQRTFSEMFSPRSDRP